MGSTDTATPLGETIQRVMATFQYITVPMSPDVPDGWLRASDIVNSPDAVDWWLERTFEIYGMDNRQVAASFLVLGYFWYPSITALGCYLLDDRLPDMSPENIALHPVHGVNLLSSRVFVLPDDPATGRPDVTIVPDRDALRARMMHQFQEEHAAPLFSTLRSIAPYGLPAMRANFQDRIASAIIWLAEQLGDDDISRREVPAFMAHARPKVRSGIIDLQHEGRRGVYLLRGGCCLNYRLPGREKCDTCSIIPMEDRIENSKPPTLPVGNPFRQLPLLLDHLGQRAGEGTGEGNTLFKQAVT